MKTSLKVNRYVTAALLGGVLLFLPAYLYVRISSHGEECGQSPGMYFLRTGYHYGCNGWIVFVIGAVAGVLGLFLFRLAKRLRQRK